MTITLTKPVEEFIQRMVAEGSYPSPTEAVNAACLMWMQESRADETPEWREYVQEKITQAANGSFHSDWDEMLSRVRRSAGL